MDFECKVCGDQLLDRENDEQAVEDHDAFHGHAADLVILT